MRPWRHAIIAPKADAGFFLMPFRRGFAERAGLRVDVLEVKDDQIGMKALLSGEVDSYEGAPGAIAAASRGADLKFIGCNWHAVPYVVLGRGDVAAMTDLRGKTIAASAPGSAPDMMARAALALHRVPAEAVTFAAVGGDRERYNALIGGVVAAAVVSNEYLPLPSSKGFRLLAEGRETLPRSVRFCVLVTGKTAMERREEAVSLIAAEIAGLRHAVADRQDTIKLTREVTDAKEDDPRPAFVYDEAIKPGVVAPDLAIPADNLVWMQDQLVELGQIPKGRSVRAAIETGIRASALDRLGR